MDTIWASSDWHCQPDKLQDAVVKWIGRGKEGHHRLIGVGDLFDVLPLGEKKWRGARSIVQLAELLEGYDFDYVCGNHDPYGAVEKLMRQYPNIKVHEKRLEEEVILDLEGLTPEERTRKYLFTHGHRWAIDWAVLRHFAPAIVEFMVAHFPRPWRWFCLRMGWLAHKHPRMDSKGKERENITRLTRVIWAGASGHALDNECCVVLGHTHTTGRRERGVSETIRTQSYMVDSGDLGKDGSYVEIANDAELCWLESG